MRKIQCQRVPQALELPRHVVGAVVLHGVRVAGRCLQPREHLRDVRPARVRRRAIADDGAHLGHKREVSSKRTRPLLQLRLRRLLALPARRCGVTLCLRQKLRNLVGRRELARGLVLLAHHRQRVRVAAQQHGHGLAVVCVRRLVERRPASAWLLIHQARLCLQRLLNHRPVESFRQVQELVRSPVVGGDALRGRCALSAGHGYLVLHRPPHGRQVGGGEGGDPGRELLEAPSCLSVSGFAKMPTPRDSRVSGDPDQQS